MRLRGGARRGAALDGGGGVDGHPRHGDPERDGGGLPGKREGEVGAEAEDAGGMPAGRRNT
jgi:hypothetical protein